MTSERFRAFSFVDRITYVGGHRIEGQYTVPPGATRFPASLMAEAVGQLAAWAAMSKMDFAWRPVAGLAGETVYHRIATPGQTMTLEASIARCDAEAVAYSGRAAIDGECVLELIDCLGPMLPMADFDAPESVRADFATLFGVGAPAQRFAGVPDPVLETLGHEPGRRLTSRLHVPQFADVAYFADHFPRRPVFPGTLLLDAIAGLTVQVADEALPGASGTLFARRVRNVKIRSFTSPGSALDLDIELLESAGDQAQMKVAARNDGKLIAAARIDVGRHGGTLP
jgi:3-hydroxymyristoyl/3-hydroxydecanoyl-(acyl carrier protein) dehydratase